MRRIHPLIYASLALIVCVTPAQADPTTHWLTAAYATTAFVDTAQTAYAHGKGVATESNPLLRPVIDRHGVVPTMAIKGALHVTASYAMLKLAKTHPRWGRVLAVAGTLLNGWVIARNHSVLAAEQREGG
jgi:peptidoglycan/LPS O-acetylase OafA/YrhL